MDNHGGAKDEVMANGANNDAQLPAAHLNDQAHWSPSHMQNQFQFSPSHPHTQDQSHMSTTDAESQTLFSNTMTDSTYPGDGVQTTFLQNPLEIDSSETDSAYAESTTSSYATSIASSVFRGIDEHGRRYHSYGREEYAFPNDEEEQDRLDMQHAMHTLLMENKLFWAPIGPNPQRILDLGTGTGIWAIDVADMFPSAQVIGTDVSPIQPSWVPSNCQFEIDDAEAEWTFKKDSFDYIHNRNFVCAIRDWPKLIRQCYEHTKPGGWVEFNEKYPKPVSDDGSLPPDSAFPRWSEKFFEAGAIFGTSPEAPRFIKGWMQEAGFINVQEHILKLPYGRWPKDKRLKDVGSLELVGLLEGAPGLSLRLFTRALGWGREEVEVFLVELRRDIKRKDIHCYMHFYIVFGQKPGSVEDPSEMTDMVM